MHELYLVICKPYYFGTTVNVPMQFAHVLSLLMLVGAFNELKLK